MSLISHSIPPIRILGEFVGSAIKPASSSAAPGGGRSFKKDSATIATRSSNRLISLWIMSFLWLGGEVQRKGIWFPRVAPAIRQRSWRLRSSSFCVSSSLFQFQSSLAFPFEKKTIALKLGTIREGGIGGYLFLLFGSIPWTRIRGPNWRNPRCPRRKKRKKTRSIDSDRKAKKRLQIEGA